MITHVLKKGGGFKNHLCKFPIGSERAFIQNLIKNKEKFNSDEIKNLRDPFNQRNDEIDNLPDNTGLLEFEDGPLQSDLTYCKLSNYHKELLNSLDYEGLLEYLNDEGDYYNDDYDIDAAAAAAATAYA